MILKMEKSKKDLIKDTQELADKFEQKKSVIETALNSLDSKSKFTQEHIDGMVIIENLFNELDEIKFQQEKIFELIKKI